MNLRVLDFPQRDPKRNHRKKDEGNKNKERPGRRRNQQRMPGHARGSRESVKGSHRAAAVVVKSASAREIYELRPHVSLPKMKKSDQGQDQQEETERTE